MYKIINLINVIELDDGFIIMIYRVDDDYECKLMHKDYGSELFMFGCPINQQTEDVFEDMALMNVDNYIDEYTTMFINDWIDFEEI